MDNKKWILYKHTNKINGKSYIGITSYPLQKRCQNNGTGYRKSTIFYRAIQKYGWDNFEHEILLEGLTKEEAIEKEIETIKKLKTTNIKYGYNISHGGDIFMLGVKHNNKTIEKFKKDRIGNKNAFYGKHHVQKSKTSAKMVICLNTLQVFFSIVDAANFYGIKRSNIGQAINNKQNSAGTDSDGNKLYWMEYNNINTDFQLELQKRIEINNKPSPICKKVICLNTLKTYDSISDAARQTKISKKGILRCCKKEVPHTNKYKWMYYDEYLQLDDDEKKNIDINDLSNKNSTTIVCLNTGEIFNTYRDAARSYGSEYGDTIRDHIRGEYSYAGIHPETGEFLKWVKYEDYKKMNEEEINNILNKKIGSRQKIICINTGEIFNTINEAAEKYGILRTGISACCRGIYKSSGKDKDGNPLVWKKFS